MEGRGAAPHVSRTPRTVGTAALLLLTTATGVIDAVSYLALDRVLTGNMTGNVLFLGFGAIGVADIPFLNNAVALLGFVVGAVIGARLVPRARAAVLPPQVPAVIAGVAVVAGTTAVVWSVRGEPSGVAQLVVTALLALLMGAQVTAVKPLGNAEITTVVVTSTLVNLARDSRLAGAPRPVTPVWLDRVLAVAAMGGGAALGAVLIREVSPTAALAASAVFIGLAALALVATRRAQRRDAGPGRGGAGRASRPARAIRPEVT